MLVFWDIDGTLLTTGRAGIFAWEDALRTVAGIEARLASFDTAGIPDFGIARRLLAEYADEPDPDEAAVRRLVTAYEERLPVVLPRRPGRVLPNVREILTALAQAPGAHSMLLTGNTRRGADAKLRHYGLAEFFEGGSFSDGPLDRDAIARAAFEGAVAGGWDGDPARTFVVGDTPHDVRCGAAIGAKTIAVATGSYDAAALASAGAWKTLRELPAGRTFLALLAGDEVAADA
ncbi:MAG TPA: HAD family hydrolase [Gemmatimonadales bacterium]|nr:HAD family hydrolase [Gemmatimonadales bacterium]